jgi:beta-N-acetylhexosaminidase
MISFLGSIFIAFFPCISEMSLEEKVGQLLVAHFNGQVVNEEAEVLLDQVHVGGIIYYEWANGLVSPFQVQQLSNGLQRGSKIPLFIGIDQEGGRVSRLKEGFTSFCSNGVVGMTGDPAFAEQVAFAMGEEMRAVGVNLNFAPVVDVSASIQEPITNMRSFGCSPELVVLFGERALHGFHRACLLATLKHFPGLGDAALDPHLDLPVIDKALDHLYDRELYPFRELVQMTDCIMTAHVLVPALDPCKCATLSPLILQDYLRDRLGFKGLIISDSLIMEGLLKQVPSVEEATIQAFEAGCDLLLLGGKRLLEGQKGFELNVQNVKEIHGALIQAVRAGRISEARVDESVKRILCVKRTLPTEELSSIDIETYVGTKEHQRLANRILNRTLRCVKPIQEVE